MSGVDLELTWFNYMSQVLDRCFELLTIFLLEQNFGSALGCEHRPVNF